MDPVAVPAEVVQWVNRNFPKPRVDHDWLQGCYEWAITLDGVRPNSQELFDTIRTQLLKSNLSESLDSTDGLPQDIGHFNTKVTLSGVPTLVEIISLSEVGSSAFQLDQVRKGREDRIRAGGFDENGEGDEEADLEVEGEGPLPKYPRSMLSFVLSDGTTQFQAMEYKPLPQLSLVQTPLGFKLQLKAVRFICGVANLEPDNVILLGGDSELNQHKDYHLRQNLRERMGLPNEPMPEFEDGEGENDENGGAGAPGPPPPPPQAPMNIRSPLREISPPPTAPQGHPEDEDMEPRRRRVPSTSSTLLPNVSRSRVSSTTSAYFPPPNPSAPTASNLAMALSPTLRAGAPTSNRYSSPVVSEPDFDWDTLNEIEANAIAPKRPSGTAGGPSTASTSRTLQPTAAAGPSTQKFPSSSSRTAYENEPEDLTLVDVTRNPSAFPRILSSAPALGDTKLHLAPGFEETFSEPPQRHSQSRPSPFGSTSQAKGKSRTIDSDDMFDDDALGFDFGSDDLRQIEAAEQQAISKLQEGRANTPIAPARTAATRSSSATLASSSGSASQRQRSARVPKPSQAPLSNADVIDIESSDDSMKEEDDGMQIDKENMPVERRRVRPRTVADSNTAGGGPPPSSQRVRPRALAGSQRMGSQGMRRPIARGDVVEISSDSD
ncbi:hypothetical protein DFP72DRAFT_898914 [Ephemerocybe angulata]|uniref:RecQ-mediated genome instability protein 1 n=1 Tax=Ephemerocybe angulata TaxID=980116 RepID=A0A8H6HZ03_9AGAR|nr:hypothetical protein DFP72DRAFT_898914 [Tulosesus angulatus]